MKRIVFAAMALALICIASPLSIEAKPAKSTVDMSHMNKIFVGWVDLNPDSYRALDYDTKDEWLKVIDGLNATFQDDLRLTYLTGRTLTFAKNRDDVDPKDSDLYIKFTNVAEDKDYRLHIAVHFIDPKTNNEIASFPEDRYGAHMCGLVGCVEKELDKVGLQIQKRVAAPK